MPPVATARARVRAELTKEITAEARHELAEVGAAALSLRSVARRVGMAPSALYRYYDSRDHLLTALIVDAYVAVATAAGRADRSAGDDVWARWLAVSRGVRGWSARHPHEWALVFGTPVPGYVGSEQTSAAAARLHRVPFAILEAAQGTVRAAPQAPLSPSVARSVAPMFDFAPGLSPAVAAAGLGAWGMVLGMISLERFGHLTGVIDDLDVYFDHSAGLAAGLAGLGAPAGLS